MSLAFPERRVLRTVLYPSCFNKREEEEDDDENTLRKARRKKKRARERERERKNSIIRREYTSRRANPHKISNLWTLKRERERKKDPIKIILVPCTSRIA